LRFIERYDTEYPDILVYTFGEPRVGNSLYAAYHGKIVSNYYRIVHSADVIPHKPAAFLSGEFYLHSGTEVWYSQGMQAIRNICEGDSNECSNSLDVGFF
jgi:predicted lipase